MKRPRNTHDLDILLATLACVLVLVLISVAGCVSALKADADTRIKILKASGQEVRVRWDPAAIQQMLDFGVSLETIILAANLEAMTGQLVDPMTLDQVLRMGERVFTDEILRWAAAQMVFETPPAVATAFVDPVEVLAEFPDGPEEKVDEVISCVPAVTAECVTELGMINTQEFWVWRWECEKEPGDNTECRFNIVTIGGSIVLDCPCSPSPTPETIIQFWKSKVDHPALSYVYYSNSDCEEKEP